MAGPLRASRSPSARLLQPIAGARRAGRHRTLAAGVLLAVLTGCAGCSSGSAPTPESPGASGATTSDRFAPVPLPAPLVGNWRGIDKRSAEVVYQFHSDGTYESTRVLMRHRPQGTFTLSVTAAGTVQVDGDELTLTQQGGRVTKDDPGSPSSSFDRPLSPLHRLTYSWSVEAGLLTLADRHGAVPLARLGVS
jgi:hypothetical protein